MSLFFCNETTTPIVIDKAIKAKQELIDKLEEERKLRLKILDIQQQSEDFESSLKQAQIRYQEALAAGAKSILIDNFNTDQMKQAVAITAGRALLEASGGINLDQMRAIASTGVDRISIGGLTKDVRAIDLSMRFKDIPA